VSLKAKAATAFLMFCWSEWINPPVSHRMLHAAPLKLCKWRCINWIITIIITTIIIIIISSSFDFDCWVTGGLFESIRAMRINLQSKPVTN